VDSELFKIVITSSLTVFGGIFVFVSGQLLSRFFIDPIHEQDKLLGETANLLILYANIWYSKENPPAIEDPFWKQIENASQDLRQKASQLRGATYSIRGYRLFQGLQVIRLSQKDALEISRNLLGWSDHLLSGHAAGCISARERIGKLLDIDVH